MSCAPVAQPGRCDDSRKHCLGNPIKQARVTSSNLVRGSNTTKDQLTIRSRLATDPVQILKTRNLSRGLRLAILALLILNSIPNLEYVKGTNQPLAAFTYYPCVACAAPGDVVFFNANASTSMTGPLVSYAWNFGDGSPTVKTSSSYQTHDFLTALPGKWQVTLTVRDINGSTDTISQLVLFNVAPDFTIQPARPETGAPVTFNESTTRVYQNATTTQPKFLWTFGDGFNGTGVIILHKYQRSEERRVGKECRSRWSPYH